MKFLFELILFLSPIQSFVITNAVKGLTLFNVGMIMYATFNVFYLKKFSRLFFPFFILFLCYVAFFSFQHLLLLFFPSPSIIFSQAIFVSSEINSDLLFRRSFFTQSLYLFLAVFFFYHLLINIMKNNADRIIKVAFFSILVFVLYGFFEFFYYFLTGEKADFISNRITGDDFSFGAFQYFNIGGVNIMRMKSLAGEPSMFAFCVVPFFILSIYLNYRWYSIGFLIALFLSTSSTAILGLILYLSLEILFGKNRIRKIILAFLIICLIGLFSYEFISALYETSMNKISLLNLSGIDRFDNFINHIVLWKESNFGQQLFGYGFGYFRSTDGLSTLLVNIGFIGLAIYCLFFLLPYFLIQKKTSYHKGLYISNFVILILILVSVPEFYTPHIWFFNALLWGEYLRLNYNNV